MTTYAELHLHTAFSFLDGASLPEELVGAAADLGYAHLAVTDHDGLFGAMEFARAARAAGIAPLVGTELTLADGSHLTLLAESARGYANLCRLITAAHGGPLPHLRDATNDRSSHGDRGIVLPMDAWEASPPPAGIIPRAVPGSPGDGAAAIPPSPPTGLTGGGIGTEATATAEALTPLPPSPVRGRGGTAAPGAGRGRGAAPALPPRPRTGEGAGGEGFGAGPPLPLGYLPLSAAHGRGGQGGEGRPRTSENYRNDPDEAAEPPDRRAPRLDPALLPAHAEGLILLTGCRQGALARAIDAGNDARAETLLRCYLAWFGRENVFVELQHNLVHGDTRRVRALADLADRAGVPVVATGNVHYHRRDRHRLQDVLVAIRHRTTLDGCHRQRRPNAEWALRSPAAMAERFRRRPDAVRATLAIAERCAGFDLTRDLAYAFPRYPTAPDDTPDAVLARDCRTALIQRYAPPERAAAEARLEDELRLIAGHGLAGFFLLYRDLLRLAADVAAELRGPDAPAATLPPGRGRGSSVGSIVCYLIGLSHIDPLAHNLMLGRFLNEELSSVPDIDLDFPREIREKLIERVYATYGADHAALVCAFPTYKLRSAVRDVGKALGLPAADLDRIAKLSEPRSARDLGAELARLPEYAPRLQAPPWCHLVELAGQLAGFPRHVSQHSGGMVVSSAPLVDLVPVIPAAMPGRYLCQWDKDSCEDAGFVKIDFLALGMLSLVEECLRLIVQGGKEPVDLSRIDFGDERVFDAICAGDTVGTFQIESRAQIQTILRTQPRSLEDLVVQVAIVRPGPIVGGAVNPYVRHREERRRGIAKPIAYDHELLKPVLEETLGVILYQEQVLGVAMALAGFSPGQADQLRRAMSRKRSHEAMLRLQDQFLAGARARGVDEATARRVFDKLLGFATYGFPKCHAAAFAVLSYQSAWLKHYYPAEFACALLNNQPMGFYPPHVLVNDARRHGVRILPPDVNRSAAACTVEGRAVRIGLGYVAGLGDEAGANLVADRAAAGPFRSLPDLLRRVPLRREAADNLVAVGAADGFGLGRREALWQIGLFVPARGFGGGRPAAEPGRQLPLALPVAADMVELRPMGPWEQMSTDYATLGLSPRYHPLGLLRARLPAEIVPLAELASLPDGRRLRVAGLVVCRQRPGTAKGITFLLLEDEGALVNVVVFPDLYETERHVIRGEPFLLVEGTLQQRNNTINLVAERVLPLAAAREQFGTPAALRSPSAPTFDDAPTTPVNPNAANQGQRGPDEGADLRRIAPASHNYR